MKLAIDLAYDVVACFMFELFSVAAATIVHCFYDEQVKITLRKLIIITGFELTLTCVLRFAPPVISDSVVTILLVFFGPAAICLWGSKNRLYKHIINYCRIILCEIFIFISSLLILEKGALLLGFTDNEEILLDANITSGLSMLAVPVLIIVGLYFTCIRKGVTLRLRRHEKLFVAVYCFMVLISYGSLEEGVEALKPMLWFTTVLLVMLTPVLIFKNRQSAYYSDLSAHNESFLEVELAASRQYREAQTETRAFRHDIKNELTLLSAMMSKGQYSEAEEYLNDMLDNVSALSPRIVTGDDMLDSLISSKLIPLEEKGIDLTVKGVLDGGLDWKPIDICSVFANAIDNAAEACSKLPDDAEKYIRITFRKTELHRIITITNPTAEQVDCNALNSGAHFTSKKDKERHGFGVRNIRRAAEKYGGILKLNCENGEFTLTIVLMK